MKQKFSERMFGASRSAGLAAALALTGTVCAASGQQDFAEGFNLLKENNPTQAAAAATRRAVEEVSRGMVLLSAGSFTMGSNKSGYGNEKPTHDVMVPAFEVGRTEVTQGQWKAVMGSNPSHFSSCGDNCPVEQVSWDDIQGFLQKLNGLTGKTYRLPSEAEWEYASRAGGQDEYCGSGNVDAVAWFDGNNNKQTHAVGQKQANAWGLHDMSGNVWEWTADCWNNSYSGAPSDGRAWTSGSCAQRVSRGGSWGNNAQNVRSAYRFNYTTADRYSFLGFRLVRTLL
jgi:formylglycine-generating enzyme required for sulfatase activity